jgi:two-component system, NtrC family, response regulator AtoC
MTTGPSLLLVDDDAPFRQVMAGELRRLGYDGGNRGIGRRGARKAAEREPERRPARPPAAGHRRPGGAETPAGGGAGAEVVMLTGHGSIDTAIESIRLGAFDYVAKPCPLDELEIEDRAGAGAAGAATRASLLERGLTPPDPAGRSSARARRSALVGIWSSGWRPPSPPCSSPARPGRARRWWPSCCTPAARAPAGPSSSSSARRCRKPCCRASCSATSAARSRGRARQARPLRGGARRHDLPRRDRRGQPGDAGEAAARAGRLDVPARGRDAGDQGGRAGDRGDQPRPDGDGGQGLFREDLFYRLSTITITVPPLRERPGDIDVLARTSWRVLNERFGFGKALAPESLDALRQHCAGDARCAARRAGRAPDRRFASRDSP